MKAPQKRTTPYIFDDNDHKQKDNGAHDRVRIKADDSHITVQDGVRKGQQYSYSGPTLGPEGIRNLRDICNAWIEHHDESDQ